MAFLVLRKDRAMDSTFKDFIVVERGAKMKAGIKTQPVICEYRNGLRKQSDCTEKAVISYALGRQEKFLCKSLN